MVDLKKKVVKVFLKICPPSPQKKEDKRGRAGGGKEPDAGNELGVSAGRSNCLLLDGASSDWIHEVSNATCEKHRGKWL